MQSLIAYFCKNQHMSVISSLRLCEGLFPISSWRLFGRFCIFVLKSTYVSYFMLKLFEGLFAISSWRLFESLLHICAKIT